MKVVVLGGAGDMGSVAVRDLVFFSKAEKITIADRNVKAAEKLAASLGDCRVSVEKVDATSHVDLMRVMRGYTIVAGALGPFYRFELPIVKAALDAGADYVSICDDHDAAEKVLQLDQAARKKGRKVLTGLGWTPGLSNLLARKGYDELDNVESIRIYWAGSAGDSQGLAVILHTIHIFTGMVTSYRGGRVVQVKAGSEKEVVQFPAPLGMVNTFHLGHPEPVTLPRYLDTLQDVTLKGGLAENYLNNLAKAVVILRLTGSDRKKQLLANILKKAMPLFPVDKEKSLSGIRVDITGIREGKKVIVSYAAVDHMSRLTGIPLSIGATMMAMGKVRRFGVFGPEADGAVQPDDFLEELAHRQVKVERSER
ncbi:MAG: saccharopine dehydrogenase NADP-binding domain-containing protein [Bacillota bacterium]|nr:saccharopine dehydrogenase NADP-binding domain-containing protein [Bacillota bacterium]